MGKLAIDEVFVDYDGPRLFSCLSDTGKRYLVIYADVNEEFDIWIYVEVTDKQLKRVRSGKISLYDVFRNPTTGELWRVRSKINDLDVFEIDRIRADEISDEVLPDPEIRLPSTEGLLVPMVSENSPRLPTPLSKWSELNMWSKLEDFLRERDESKIVPPLVAAQRSLQHIVDISFKRPAVPTRRDIPAATLGKMLTVFQSLADAIGQATFDTPTVRGVVPRFIRERTKLVATESFGGSFGLRLETEQGDLAIDKNVREAFSELVSLMEVGSDEEKLHQKLMKLGGRSAAHYRAFTRLLVMSDLEFGIELASPLADTTVTAALRHNELGRIVSSLDTLQEKLKEEFQVRGRLVAVSLPTKSFTIDAEDEIYRGRIADHFMPHMHHQLVDGLYNVKLNVEIKVNEITGEEKQSYTLLQLTTIE